MSRDIDDHVGNVKRAVSSITQRALMTHLGGIKARRTQHARQQIRDSFIGVQLIANFILLGQISILKF